MTLEGIEESLKSRIDGKEIGADEVRFARCLPDVVFPIMSSMDRSEDRQAFCIAHEAGYIAGALDKRKVRIMGHMTILPLENIDILKAALNNLIIAALKLERHILENE